jgi:squalene-hopene/tetraprenyl-beta-curcumene cyclase
VKAVTLSISILGAAVGLFAADVRTPAAEPAAWSGKAAAAYLDSRMTWWMSWPAAARDHDTFCVSCHTAVPYAMARPALRSALAEQTPSPVERRLLDNVVKRVRLWSEVAPFYPDESRGVPKTSESRGTESILNAVILIGYDFNADARLALDNMWAQQLKTGEASGAWPWLQFHNAPWEGDSQYFGAALAAIAASGAPASYRDSTEVREATRLLGEYLVRAGSSQTPLDRLMLLWASARMPGLLTPAAQQAIVDEALARQQPDGGFSLSAFVGAWKRKDGTPLDARSDGYATGLVAFVLRQAGVPRDQPALRRSLRWLTINQDRTDGRWVAFSLNKQRDPASDVGRFMSDAATAYAVLALERAGAEPLPR